MRVALPCRDGSQNRNVDTPTVFESQRQLSLHNHVWIPRGTCLRTEDKYRLTLGPPAEMDRKTVSQLSAIAIAFESRDFLS